MSRLFSHFVRPLLPLLFVVAALPTSAQRRYETFTGFSVPTEIALPAQETHPSLYFRQADLVAIRARRDRARAAPASMLGPDWAALDADQAAFKRRSSASTDVNDRPRYAKSLAFRWVVANDAVARDSALSAMRRMYEGVPQAPVAASFERPFMPIFRATWLQNYCAAYDWLHAAMTPVQRDSARVRIGREAELLRRHMVEGVVYAPRPQNFRLKAAYALGTAALTLSSDPRAADWLRVALAQQNSVTRYQFSADGVYREGPHYLVYILVNGLPFLWQAKNVTGADLFPAYAPVFEAAVRLRGTQGWAPPFEDGAPKPVPAHMAAAAYRTRTTDLRVGTPLAEVLQWHWQTTALPTRDYTGATNDVTWELDAFLLADDLLPAAAPTAPPVQLLASGAVALRTAWTGSDARTLVMSALPEGDNHQHPDRLGYHMDAFGTVLAPDAGYGPAGAADPKRAWYTSVDAHNTVAVGSGPTIASDAMRNDDNAGHAVETFLEAPWGTFAELSARDANVPGSGRLSRGVLMTGGAFVVVDAAAGSDAADYALLVHGRGSLTLNGNTHRWSAPADIYGRAADLAVAIAGGATPTTAAGWTNLAWGHEESQTYLRAAQRAAAPVYLHALVPLLPGAAAPALTTATDGATARLTLATPVTETRVVARATSGALDAADGTTATARVLWSLRTLAGPKSRLVEIGAVGATLVRDGARVLVQSTAPVSMTRRQGGPGVEELVVGAAATLDLWPLDAGTSVSIVLVGGEPVVSTALAGGGVRVSLPAGAATLRTALVSPAEAGRASTGLRLRAFPSPSNGPVTLDLAVPQGTGQAASLVAYNALGQAVWRATATGALVWDGRGDGGQALAPGVYILEARTGRDVVRQSVVRLR